MKDKCECLEWEQVGHDKHAYWPMGHIDEHHPDCEKYRAPGPGCSSYSMKYAAGSCHVDIGGHHATYGPHRSDRRIPLASLIKAGLHLCIYCGSTFVVTNERAQENEERYTNLMRKGERDTPRPQVVKKVEEGEPSLRRISAEMNKALDDKDYTVMQPSAAPLREDINTITELHQARARGVAIGFEAVAKMADEQAALAEHAEDAKTLLEELRSFPLRIRKEAQAITNGCTWDYDMSKVPHKDVVWVYDPAVAPGAMLAYRENANWFINGMPHPLNPVAWHRIDMPAPPNGM